MTGITSQSQRNHIINEKIKDLFINYEVEEYVNIEKRKLCEKIL